MLRNSALEVFQILACCTIFYYCAHAQIVSPRSASRPTTIRIPVYILSVYLSYTIVTLPVIILAMITEIIHDIALNILKHMDHKDEYKEREFTIEKVCQSQNNNIIYARKIQQQKPHSTYYIQYDVIHRLIE